MIEDFNSKEKVYEYLKSHHIAALSTVSGEGEPYGALIYVFADSELNFYFFTKAKTKKVQNLIGNDKAALTVFDPILPRTIQAQGIVEQITDTNTYSKLFSYLEEQSAKEEQGLYYPPPISKVYVEGDLNLYKFIPRWLRFADFSEAKTLLQINLQDNFFQIIPQKI